MLRTYVLRTYVLVIRPPFSFFVYGVAWRSLESAQRAWFWETQNQLNNQLCAEGPVAVTGLSACYAPRALFEWYLLTRTNGTDR